MGNVIAANFHPQMWNIPSTTDSRQIFWKLTRVLKSAGWITKSSGNTNTKDTTGTYLSDLWNGYGLPIPGQNGFAAASTGGGVITGLTGMTANSVGRYLQLNGSIQPGDIGYYKIITFTSATQVTVLGMPTSETLMGWQELDNTYVTGTGSTASLSTFTNNRVVTVTGLTGMTPLSANRWLTISGAATGANNGTFKILKYISSTSVTIINTAGVAPDGNNGAISWREVDPNQEQYIDFVNTGSLGSWINMQGPSTLRIRITSASTGTFIRGETVIQSTTGAQGEIIGYQFDTTANDGYLIVMPQINGNGAGVQGWDGTHGITGLTSGAIVTPSNTPVEFVRELVIWNLSQTNGWVATMQCVDSVGESASRFSVLAGSTGCTASVCPGGGGTANAFPTAGSYCWLGNIGTQTSSTSFAGVGSTQAQYRNAQLMCADATYDGYRSADGSFTCAVSTLLSGGTSTALGGCHIGFVFTRVDNQEDGDVDPYVMYQPESTPTIYTGSRTSMLGSFTTSEDFTAANVQQAGGTTNWPLSLCRGFRRRGMTTPIATDFQIFSLATIGVVPSSANSFSSGSIGALGMTAKSDDTALLGVDGAKISTRGNTVVGEPIWIVSAQSGGPATSQKMRKGTARWMRLVGNGSTYNLYGGGLWVQVSNSLPAFIVGPWDGITIPQN